MVVVIATLSAKRGAEAEVHAILKGLTEGSASEPGARGYAVHRDPKLAGRFVVYERYVDQAACDAHMGSAPLRSALARFETLLSEPPQVQLLEELERSQAER